MKPVPLAPTAEIVALALPVFVKVIVCWPLLPTATFPNVTLVGTAAKVELSAAALPVRLTVCGEPGALSVNVMLPVAPPAVVGAKRTLNDADCPAVRVIGKERPLMPKPVPVTVAKLITTLVEPLFVN